MGSQKLENIVLFSFDSVGYSTKERLRLQYDNDLTKGTQYSNASDIRIVLYIHILKGLKPNGHFLNTH